MSDLEYVGPSPANNNDFATKLYTANTLPGPVSQASANSSVSSAIANYETQSAFNSALGSYALQSTVNSGLAANVLTTSVGAATSGGVTGVASLDGSSHVPATQLKNAPMASWAGPYTISTSWGASDAFATGSSMPYTYWNQTLGNITIPAFSDNSAGQILVFGQFEAGAYNDGGTYNNLNGRAEVFAQIHGAGSDANGNPNQVVAYGTTSNGNGVGGNWPIVMVPYFTSDVPASFTGSVQIDFYLRCGFGGTKVKLAGANFAYAFRVPV